MVAISVKISTDFFSIHLIFSWVTLTMSNPMSPTINMNTPRNASMFPAIAPSIEIIDIDAPDITSVIVVIDNLYL